MIELEDWSEKKVYAEYSSFRLEPESDYYRLRLGTYQGNAGDSMMWHNGKQFTTLDRDKDMYTGKTHKCGSFSTFYALNRTKLLKFIKCSQSQKGYFGHNQRKYNIWFLGFLRQPQYSLGRTSSGKSQNKTKLHHLEKNHILAGHLPCQKP